MGETEAKPTVSVVVPVYNLETCVTYCVKSLAAQTYENCEFILVDDGSSDGTPALLDELTSGDERFRVFHEMNHGPARARNFGVEVATGELVTFVDGDDFVHSGYVEKLVAAYKGSGKGMVVGRPTMVRFEEEKSDSILEADPSFSESHSVFDTISQKQVIEYACYENRVFPSACSCLALRDQYLNTPFPDGLAYEDVYIYCSYISEHSSLGLLNQRLYGYVMRENSVVNRKRAQVKQAHDFVTAINKFCSDARRISPDSVSAIAYFEAHHLCQLHDLCMVVEDNPAEAGKIDLEARARLRELVPITKGDIHVSRAQQLRFDLLAWHPKIYECAFGLYRLLKKGF